MKQNKKKTIEELITSKGGVHFSLYFQRGMTLHQVKRQFLKAIVQTQTELFGKLTEAQIHKFLAPLWAVYSDENLLKRMKCSYAIFRSEKEFEIIKIPIGFDSFWSLADSFFVKPLLKWVQTESEFLFVGINERQAKIYFGDMSEIYLVDHINYELEKENENIFLTEFAFWLNEWILNLNQNSHYNIVFVSNLELVENLKYRIKKGKKKIINLNMEFNSKFINAYTDEIRKSLINQLHRNLLLRVEDIHNLNFNEFLSKDLFEIAEAVSQRKVKKLLVSEDYKIFGIFNQEDGKLDIHVKDSTFEDDDLLDDLAQAVLKYGGEVIVVNKKEFQIDHPAVAVIEDKGFEYLVS